MQEMCNCTIRNRTLYEKGRDSMKKLGLLIMAVIGVTAGIVGYAMVKFSKNMENWEMAWDDADDKEVV